MYIGGSPIYIEAVGIPIQAAEKEGSGKEAGASGAGHGSIHMVTGHLGTVMKESVNIAFTFTRKFLASQ
jgi:ATP-dependent Lon protease